MMVQKLNTRKLVTRFPFLEHFLTSVQLWRALRNPPDQHPLFRHLVLTRTKFDLKPVWAGLVVLVVILLFISQELGAFLMVAIPMCYALLNSTINGLVWGTNVTNTLVSERVRGTYDVLCLIPDGALRVNWIVFIERLHYNESLENSFSDMRVIVQILAIGLAFLFLGVLADPRPEIIGTMGAVMIVMLCVMAGIYADYVQTVITCGFIAILASNRTRFTNDAKIWMVSGFLLVQMGMYILLIILLLVLGPTLGNLDLPAQFPMAVLIPILILTIYVGVREAIINILWHQVADTLNADHSLNALLIPTRW